MGVDRAPGDYPPFILPTPFAVAQKAFAVLADGSLLHHAAVTLLIALGLTLGVGTALVLGYVLGKNRAVEQFVAPYLVASQSVPVVAIAPLLVIWFGSGLLSKVLVCALITFFPTLISTIVGLRTVDRERHLMRSLKANRWQTFRKLELPSALPIVFGGLKLSVILAVVGAVVTVQFMGASAGLGFLISLGMRRFRYTADVRRHHQPGGDRPRSLSGALVAGTQSAALAAL